MTTVLIPVKNLEGVKKRLAPLLEAEERKCLAQSMLADVAVALAPLQAIIEVVVVSGDPWAAEFAERHGWRVLEEQDQVSESRSIDWASAILQRRGTDRVLRLPADIPLIQADDVLDLIQMPGGNRNGVIVPSADGTGTNALLRSPPDLFPSRFGPGSFELHHVEARRRHATLETRFNPQIALDIDTPGDLIEFERRGSATQSWQMLNDSGIFKRLGSWSDAPR